MNKVLKNFIAITSLTFAVALSAAAQSYTIVPNDTIVANAPMDEPTVYDIVQTDNSADTLHLSWEKVSVSLPDQWLALICDNNTCYPDLHVSGNMLPVFQGQDGLLSLHITPQVNAGTALIRYIVWDVNNAAMKDTLTWIISAFSVGINEVQKNPFFIFTSGNEIVVHQNTSELNRIRLIDLNGRVSQEIFSSASELQLNVSALAAGLYFVEVGNRKSFFTKKILISEN